MTKVARVGANTKGRDFAVGDIHGYFSRLDQALGHVGFDRAVDRLFSVGDLVDRGPESGLVLTWLSQPWFHAVRGNHEDMAIRFAKGNPIDEQNYSANGGDWMLRQAPERRDAIGKALGDLPLAIEIETMSGIVGIVHADCPFASWGELVAALEAPQASRAFMNSVEDCCMWSRTRITNADACGVQGVRALVVGHTPMREPTVLGNVFHIDTAGWTPNGHFTFIDLNTLEIRPTARTTLDYSGAR